MAVEVSSEGPGDRVRDVLGVEAHFREQGAGPGLLLVHDWLETAAGFRPLMRELGPRYHCVAPDLPGFGGTPTPEGWEGTLASYSDFLQATLRECALRDATLVLHGFGVLVGVKALSDHGGEASRRVARLVLLNGPIFEPKGQGLARLKRWDAFEALRRAPPLDLMGFRRRLLSRYGDPTYFDETFVEELFRAWRPRGPTTLVQQARHLPEFREALPKLQEDLEGWPGPVHVLWGEEDPLLGDGPARLMEVKLRRAEVLLFPEVGHLPHVEAPQAVAEELRRFVRASGPIRPTASEL